MKFRERQSFVKMNPQVPPDWIDSIPAPDVLDAEDKAKMSRKRTYKQSTLHELAGLKRKVEDR